MTRDNALAESAIGLYKTELIKPAGSWRTAEQVELATLHCAGWFSRQRLYEAPPATPCRPGRQAPGRARCPPSRAGLLNRDVAGVPARPVPGDGAGGDPARVHADEADIQVLAGDTGPHRPPARPSP